MTWLCECVRATSGTSVQGCGSRSAWFCCPGSGKFSYWFSSMGSVMNPCFVIPGSRDPKKFFIIQIKNYVRLLVLGMEPDQIVLFSGMWIAEINCRSRYMKMSNCWSGSRVQLFNSFSAGKVLFFTSYGRFKNWRKKSFADPYLDPRKWQLRIQIELSDWMPIHIHVPAYFTTF